MRNYLTNKKIKKVFLLSSRSCKPSKTDSNLIKKYLKENRLYSNSIDKADLVLVNTCGFTRQLEDQSLKDIGYAQQNKKESAEIVVIGCLPSINKKRLKKIFSGFVISARNLNKLDDIINPKVKLSEIKYSGFKSHKKSDQSGEYLLRIGWGCGSNCSYCAIKNVFGSPQSRSISDILTEFKIAIAKGYKKFLFVANEVSSYGLDRGCTIADLINKIMKIKSNFSIGLTNFLPNDFKRYLLLFKKYIQQNRVYYVYLACQSGSDKILRLMNRDYTVNDIRHCVRQLRSLNPKIFIKTDLIVGFPQETEKDFTETLSLIKWLAKYNVKIQVFPFSVRPNTEAREMHGHLNKRIINIRFRRVQVLLYFLDANFNSR